MSQNFPVDRNGLVMNMASRASIRAARRRDPSVPPCPASLRTHAFPKSPPCGLTALLRRNADLRQERGGGCRGAQCRDGLDQETARDRDSPRPLSGLRGHPLQWSHPRPPRFDRLSAREYEQDHCNEAIPRRPLSPNMVRHEAARVESDSPTGQATHLPRTPVESVKARGRATALRAREHCATTAADARSQSCAGWLTALS